MPPYTPILLQHVNLPVPKGTLHLAQEFYGEVIGFENDPVPQLQREILLWFRIGDGPQQIHVAFENISPDSKVISSRHPCFQISSPEALLSLQKRIYEHKQSGAESSALECDQPGEENSGAKGVEYPTRFFVRDYAGNRLEFSAPN
ncbi:hypothetical protein L486_03701 [Kwoniella mangroviensis CBS 10435]|uniref:VOC domain-containing protein n=1 Tax=Kwoniella mangroviensis CBS 10435 TaxID=1331196 RepID=A0A1B9IUI5_9TREE|nr:hypothetical protein L486_03701 [Kwoniella mangroviensis CBS 10435]OCF76548.1 hypothetical protein I204_02245 [Kwoniella mangroviensis CBS 8886]